MLSTLDGVRRAGYRPEIAAPDVGPLADAVRAMGIKVCPFETHDAAGVRRPLGELRAELGLLLGKVRPQLLHANSLAMGRLSGPVAAEAGVPSLSHVRDIVGLSRQAASDLNAHRRLLAVSEATRQFHIAQGVDAQRIFTLFNGVDLNRFRSQPRTGYLHRELGLPEEMPLIGTLGQISLRKGQDILAAALTSLADRRSFAWLIIGERFSGKAESQAFEAGLRQMAAGPLAGRMVFLGGREDVAKILNELTLLVHPARQEPLGRVLLEAASAGVAVVATDVGGTCEIFPAGSESARLVAAGTADGLATAIGELLENASLRSQIAANARQRMESYFSIDKAVDGLLRHYGEISAGILPTPARSLPIEGNELATIEDEPECGPQPRSPLQFTIWQMFVLTTVVALICSAAATWHAAVLLVIAAAIGAFLGALICPWVGLEYVLDDLRMDLLRCLVVGAYLVGAAWAIWSGMGWLAHYYRGEVLSGAIAGRIWLMHGGLLLCLPFSVGLLVQFLWPKNDKIETVIVTFATLLATLGLVAIVALF